MQFSLLQWRLKITDLVEASRLTLSHLPLLREVENLTRVPKDRVLWTATKVAVGVGAVYITMDQGVWSSSNQGSSALDKVRTKVLPTANEYYNKVPDVGTVNNEIKNKWNYGIETAFSGIAATPSVVEDYSKKAISEVKRNLTSS